MFRLFETISIRDGVAENLKWHQQRLNSSCLALFGIAPSIDLTGSVRVPPECRSGHYRCRVDYDRRIREIRFTPYQAREINSLMVLEDNMIDYRFKFSDRQQLDRLFSLRGSCDDVLIVKNSLITDSSAANILLWDGQKWFTPSEPLLTGTCRARLLENGLISEAVIRISELHLFKEIRLINALRGIEDSKPIRISNIRQ